MVDGAFGQAKGPSITAKIRFKEKFYSKIAHRIHDRYPGSHLAIPNFQSQVNFLEQSNYLARYLFLNIKKKPKYTDKNYQKPKPKPSAD